MKITTNREVNRQIGATYTTDNKYVNKNEKAVIEERTVEVSLSTEQGSNVVRSDEGLQCALENLLVSQSSVYDVQQAEEMIAKVNRNILANADEAVLAQANQTPVMVIELTQ